MAWGESCAVFEIRTAPNIPAVRSHLGVQDPNPALCFYPLCLSFIIWEMESTVLPWRDRDLNERLCLRLKNSDDYRGPGQDCHQGKPPNTRPPVGEGTRVNWELLPPSDGAATAAQASGWPESCVLKGSRK